MICQNLNSTYAYDFPEIFANVLAEKGRNDEDAPQPGIKRLVELVLELPAGSSHQLVVPGHGKSGNLVEVEPRRV